MQGVHSDLSSFGNAGTIGRLNHVTTPPHQHLVQPDPRRAFNVFNYSSCYPGGQTTSSAIRSVSTASFAPYAAGTDSTPAGLSFPSFNTAVDQIQHQNGQFANPLKSVSPIVPLAIQGADQGSAAAVACNFSFHDDIYGFPGRVPHGAIHQRSLTLLSDRNDATSVHPRFDSCPAYFDDNVPSNPGE